MRNKNFRNFKLKEAIAPKVKKLCAGNFLSKAALLSCSIFVQMSKVAQVVVTGETLNSRQIRKY